MRPSSIRSPVLSVKSSEGEDFRRVKGSSSPKMDQSSPIDVSQDPQLLNRETSLEVETPGQPVVEHPLYGRMSLSFLTQNQDSSLDPRFLLSQSPSDSETNLQDQFRPPFQTPTSTPPFIKPSTHQPIITLSTGMNRRKINDIGENAIQHGSSNPSRDDLSSSPKNQDIHDDGMEMDAIKEERSPKKRRRVETACNACRKRRSKCGGGSSCHSCLTNHTECVYPPPTRKLTLKHFEELERKIAELQSLNDAYEGRTSIHDPRVLLAESLRIDTTQLQTQQPVFLTSGSFPSDLLPSVSSSPSNMRSIQEDGKIYSQLVPRPTLPFDSQLLGKSLTDDSQSQSISVNNLFLRMPSRSITMEREREVQLRLNKDESKASETDTSDVSDTLKIKGTPEAVRIKNTNKTQKAVKSDYSDTGFDSSARRPHWERLGQFGYSTDVVEDAAANLYGTDRDRSIEMVPDTFVMHAMEPPASGETIFYLPSQAEAESLLHYYRERIHYILPVFDFVDLYDRYLEAACWPELKPRAAIDLVFQASLNLIFSIVAVLRCSKEDLEKLPIYFRNSQSIMSVTHVLIMANVEMIQYLLLLCYYSQNCSKGLLAVNAVGLAISMSRNIQLDKSEINLKINVREKCIRQRVWAACIQMEATISAMLYRQTTLNENDFAINSMTLIDDDNFYPSTQRSIEQPQDIMFFHETTKLFAIKIEILRKLYASKDHSTLPNTSTLVELEIELHGWWDEVPSHLKDENRDVVLNAIDTRLQTQGCILKSRYRNTLVLLYRPFLFFFCSAPRSNVPFQTNMRYDIARKAAALCAEAAVSLINGISRSWDGAQLGFWWCMLGYVYNSSLVILAHRIVNQAHPASINSNIDLKSTEAVRQGLRFLQIVGTHSGDAFEYGSFHSTPPKSAQSTARRCFKILTNIQQAGRAPPKEKEAIMAVFRESGEQDVRPECQIQCPDPSALYMSERGLSSINASRDNEPLSDSLQNAESNLDEDVSTYFKPFEFNPNPDLTLQSSWQDWTSLLEAGLLFTTDVVDDVLEHDGF